MLSTPIQVDGSFGEGGGALCRTALLMAAYTEQPLRLHSVRGGTKFPGLTHEDLVLVDACAKMTGAEVRGASLGSNDLAFAPVHRCRAAQGGFNAEESEHTQCCASVILGSIIPLVARSGAYSMMTAVGETHGLGILNYDYFSQVTIEAYRRMGLYAFVDLIQSGFGRGTRGEVACEVEPSAMHGIQWSHRGQLLDLRAFVSTSNLPRSVGERGAAHLARLASGSGVRLDVECQDLPGESTGACITLVSRYEQALGGTHAMGQKGLRIEAVAQNAYDQMMQWMRSSATVDAFLADQILLPCVLAEGDSSFSVPRVTARLLTMAWVIRQFLPIHITIHGEEGKPGTVSIRRP